MAQKVQLPDGTFFPMKQGETPEQALMVAAGLYPDAFAPKPAAEAGPKSGGIAALKAGASNLKSDIATLLGRTGAIAPETASRVIEEEKQYRAKTFKPTETFGEAPLTKFSELLGGSVPYMAAPLAAGAAAVASPVLAGGAALTGTAATVAGLGAAGAASYTQFLGSFLSRQMDTGKKLGETELGTAALAALPAAALDTVSLRMIPGIRGILGAAGREVTEAEAKAIAQQGLGRTFGDYVAKSGKTAGVEGLTESAQQVLERMQAGLSITDADARKEYFDSFLGGAVLGGTLAVPGRALERGKIKTQAEQAEARDKEEARKVAAQAKEAERAAEEARKQDPAYMREAVAQSAALEQQKRDLQAQVIRAPKGETLTEEQRQANIGIQAQLKELAPKLTEASKESNRVKPLLAKIDADARRAGMSPEDYMLQQMGMSVKPAAPVKTKLVVNELGQVEEVPEAPKAVPPSPTEVEQYVQQQIQAAKDAGALTLADRIDYLMADPIMADQMVKTRTPMPDLSKQETKALYGALELQLKALEKQRASAAQAATSAAQQRLGTVEAEEQAALEESQRQQAELDAEAERNRKIAPEILAQRRIAERPAVGVAGLINQLPLAGPAPGPAGSSAMGRTAQELQGLPIGAEGQPIYTAEEEKAPAPAAAPQRVKGQFRLFNLPGAPERAADVESIQERLARVLAQKDLDQDAYDFLRRAEDIAPTATPEVLSLLDRQLELIEQGQEGVVPPEAAATRPTLYQGFPVKGAQAEAAAPTMAELRDIQKNASADPKTLTDVQRRRAQAYNRYIEEGKSPAQAAGYAYRDSVAQPEGERVAVAPAEVPKTVRGKESTGRTLSLARQAGAAPLSYRQELEPFLRLAEQTAGPDLAETQQRPLFEEEEAKLGVAFTTPEEFEAFLRSDEANRMRGELLLANKINDKLTQLPKLEMRVAVLAERLDRLFDLRKEATTLKALTKNRNTTDMAGRQWEKLSEGITKFVVDRMELANKIGTLTEHKNRLEELLKASNMPAMRVKGKIAPAVSATAKLKKELSSVLKDLEAAQTTLNKMSATAKRAETMLRVLRAQDRLNEMYMDGGEAAAVRMFPDTVIDSARRELAAAVAELEPVQKKESEARMAAQVEAGNERRRQAAVAAAKAEDKRVEARKEEQRRLEARFADTVDRQQVPAISEAQKDAREMDAPTFNPVELNEIKKSPAQVLGGYRSAITAVEKQVRAAQERSKEARLKQLAPLKAKVDQLEQSYRAAKAADARAALLPQIEAATAEYAKNADRLNAQPLTWKGMAGQIKALADLYNKADFLEAKIGPNGEFAASVLEDKAQFRALLSKERQETIKSLEAKYKKADTPKERSALIEQIGTQRREGLAASAEQNKQAEKKAAAEAEARDVAARENAPATSGEALTRSEAAKARKQQQTVFGTPGIGAEVAAKEAEEIKTRAIIDKTMIGIRSKQKARKPLTDLEKSILAQEEAKAKAKTVAMEYTTATRTPADLLVQEAIRDGRLLDALDRLSFYGTNDLIRESAKELRGLVTRTKVLLDANLIIDGKPVPAAYSPKLNAVIFRPTEISDENIIHEVTHAATMRVLSMPEADLTPRQRAAKKEIEDIFAKLEEDTSLADQYGLDDVKEFVSEIQSNVEFRAAIDKQPWYKQLWNAIVRLFSKAPAETVSERASRLVREIYLPSAKIAEAPAVASVFRSTKPQYESENALTDLADRIIAQPKSFKDRMGSNLALEAEMNAVDMRAGLQEALKRGAKDMGNDELFTQAMYNVRKADQAMPLVYTALSNGPLEFYTDDKGLRGIKSSNDNNAQEIFNAVKAVPGKNTEAKFALASTYMIAQRAANKGLSKLDIGELGLTEADLASAMDAANADPALKSALEEVRRRYNAFNEGQIKFLADAGVISKADAKAWLKDGDYVPYYRVREDGTAELVFGGEKTLTIGDIRTQPYLAELKGGENKILPLNESIIRNTMLITRAALTNNATKEIAYAMQSFGEGKGAEGKNSMPIKRGSGPAGADVIRFKQEPDPKDPKDDGQRWLRISTKNTPMEGIPAELVVKSLEGAHLTLPAFLKIGGIAGDWLRKGVTRMPPYIFRQLIRDPMAASFTGGLNYGPFRAVVMAGTEFLRSSAGRSAAAKNLIEKGLVQSNVFTGDPDDMSAFATQLASGKDGAAIDRLMGYLDRAAIRADAATRALVYDNARKNGLSEVEADMATMESMNFYKRGLSPTVQYANRLIPFMNAQIQGLNVLAKAMRGNMPFEERQRIQRKFWNNAVMLFGVGLVYAMAMDDDETFKNAKPRDKYTNFFVNLPGVSEAVKVPLPYESGWFFSAAVALADAMKAEVDGKQQLKALKDMFLSSVPGYSSVFMPQAVKPLLEVFTNKNFFSGQNIESAAMLGRSPEDRFNAATTEVAKAMGKVLPLSPIQIEHLARGYFGTAPLALMSVASGFMREEGKGEAPERRLSETPILGTVFQRKYGGADADTMYAFAKEATQRASSLAELRKTGTPEEYREYLANHRAEIAMAPMARNFETLMGRIRTQENVVRNRKDLSSEEKRARLDQLDKAKQDVADKFNAAVRRAEAARAS